MRACIKNVGARNVEPLLRGQLFASGSAQFLSQMPVECVADWKPPAFRPSCHRNHGDLCPFEFCKPSRFCIGDCQAPHLQVRIVLGFPVLLLYKLRHVVDKRNVSRKPHAEVMTPCDDAPNVCSPSVIFVIASPISS